MYPDSQDIASLISSRICHDLISPIGAISNGLELMQMSAPASGPEYDLISDSVASATARINFFRVAFGPDGGGLELSQNELRQTLDAFYAGSRVRVVWNLSGPVPRPLAKLALLLVLSVDSWLPLGGTLTVTAEGDAWQIEANADRINVNPDTLAHLVGKDAQPVLKPSEIHFELARRLASQVTQGLTVDQAERGPVLRYQANLG